ncbi:MAG: hypothetical protein AAF790_15165, partial [Planctomycetota bacterium]
AIATGDDHYVQFSRTSGVVTSYAVMRDPSSGVDYAVEDARPVPAGATVTTASDTLTFDFTGALTTSGTSSVVRTDGANFYWNATVYHATGYTELAKVAQP